MCQRFECRQLSLFSREMIIWKSFLGVHVCDIGTPWHLPRRSVCEYKCPQYQPVSIELKLDSRASCMLLRAIVSCSAVQRYARRSLSAWIRNLNVQKLSHYRRHGAEAVGTPWAMQMAEVSGYREELWAGAYVTNGRSDVFVTKTKVLREGYNLLRFVSLTFINCSKLYFKYCDMSTESLDSRTRRAFRW